VSGQLVVAFERLLLEKKDSKQVTLANTSVLPIKWRFAGEQQQPRPSSSCHTVIITACYLPGRPPWCSSGRVVVHV
jgi:hypothetical protein